MEVHKESQTFTPVRRTIEEFKSGPQTDFFFSFSFFNFFLIRTTHMICRMSRNYSKHPQCSETDGFASFVARFVSFVACRRILREIAAVGTRGKNAVQFETVFKECVIIFIFY